MAGADSREPGRRGLSALTIAWALFLAGFFGLAGVLVHLSYPESELSVQRERGLRVALPDRDSPVAEEAPVRQASPEPVDPESEEGGPLPTPSAGPPPAARERPASSGERPAALPPAPLIDRPPSEPAGPEPAVAIVLTGLGPSASMAEQAIRLLPAEVTLSFDPYSRNLAALLDQARADGHAVFLDLPMDASPSGEGASPRGLSSRLPTATNLERLDWLIKRAQGTAAGFTVEGGGALLESPEKMRPLIARLASAGMLLIDPGQDPASAAPWLAIEAGMPALIGDELLGRDVARQGAIDRGLRRLERAALEDGQAIALARPDPVTLERLALWIESLENRGLVLAPVTALAEREAESSAEAGQ